MKKWPVDTTEELNRRISLLHKLKVKPELRAAVMLHYKHNPSDFINDWCITYDPRKKAPEVKMMPFRLFQRQEEFILFLNECLEDKENGLIEKARDIGASWLCVAYSVWLWLFMDGAAIGWGSRKEEYVDKIGDMKAIFPKIRLILSNLPRWMLPEGFAMEKHAPYMRIINPATGATITGEAGNNIGRGGRTTIFFKDESAHYEDPESIEAALGDNTDVQIDISSVNGSANVFYRRRMAGSEWYPGNKPEPGKTRVFVFDWRDHPLKTQEWYDLRRARAEAEGLLHLFKQEVDRDYSGSIDKIIIPADWVNSAVDAHIKLGFRFDGEKCAGQDIADEGGDKNALAIRHGVVLRYADHWGGDSGEAARTAIPKAVEIGANELYYDSIGVGSGFKTEVNTMAKEGAIPSSLIIMKWNAAASVLDPTENLIPGDSKSPTNEEFFGNLKAQAWWRLRTRFHKTHLAVTRGNSYDSGELISLSSEMPRLHEVKMELSQAVRAYNTKGKVIVDKKPKGARSPNLADAIVMCYNPTREVSIFDVL